MEFGYLSKTMRKIRFVGVYWPIFDSERLVFNIHRYSRKHGLERRTANIRKLLDFPCRCTRFPCIVFHTIYIYMLRVKIIFYSRLT